MSKVSVNLNASAQPDGSVVCELECDGQEVKITFTGTDILIDVAEPAGEERHATEGIYSPGGDDIGALVPPPGQL